MWNLIVDLWNTVIFEPIFNLITALIALIPGHNFGIALILFTVITRLLLYPIIKKQLEQIKKQKDLQPELQKIKKANKGDRQKVALETISLYKKNSFNPFAVLGYLLIQIPIFIGLYQVINRVSINSQNLVEDSYSFVKKMPWVKELKENPDIFDPTLLGLVDLTRSAVDNPGLTYESSQINGSAEEISSDTDEVSTSSQSSRDLSLEYDSENELFNVSSNKVSTLEYAVVSDEADCSQESTNQKEEFSEVQDNQIAVSEKEIKDKSYVCVRGDGDSEFYFGAFLIVLAAAFAQFFTSKQIIASNDSGKKKKTLRQLLKEQAEGKEPDQSEFSAATNGMIIYIMPVLIFVISLGWFSALPFYWFLTGIMQYFQHKKVNSQEKVGAVKAVINDRDIFVTVEKPLNAKQKKEQAKSIYSASKKRGAKRVEATTKTIKKKNNKKG